jgi:uncharacterized membrane protein
MIKHAMTTLAVAAALTLGASADVLARQQNPCAAKNTSITAI